MPDDTIPPPANGSMSASEVLHLINLFDKSLESMEKRLVSKMDENSEGARERWQKHDAEFERNRNLIVARFEKVEAAILTVEKALEAHLDREHDEDIAVQARVRPIKMSVTWIWSQRKDILLFIIFMLATAAAVGEWFGRLVAPHSP